MFQHGSSPSAPNNQSMFPTRMVTTLLFGRGRLLYRYPHTDAFGIVDATSKSSASPSGAAGNDPSPTPVNPTPLNATVVATPHVSTPLVPNSSIAGSTSDMDSVANSSVMSPVFVLAGSRQGNHGGGSQLGEGNTAASPSVGNVLSADAASVQQQQQATAASGGPSATCLGLSVSTLLALLGATLTGALNVVNIGAVRLLVTPLVLRDKSTTSVVVALHRAGDDRRIDDVQRFVLCFAKVLAREERENGFVSAESAALLGALNATSSTATWSEIRRRSGATICASLEAFSDALMRTRHEDVIVNSDIRIAEHWLDHTSSSAFIGRSRHIKRILASLHRRPPDNLAVAMAARETVDFDEELRSEYAAVMPVDTRRIMPLTFVKMALSTMPPPPWRVHHLLRHLEREVVRAVAGLEGKGDDADSLDLAARLSGPVPPDIAFSALRVVEFLRRFAIIETLQEHLMFTRGSLPPPEVPQPLERCVAHGLATACAVTRMPRCVGETCSFGGSTCPICSGSGRRTATATSAPTAGGGSSGTSARIGDSSQLGEFARNAVQQQQQRSRSLRFIQASQSTAAAEKDDVVSAAIPTPAPSTADSIGRAVSAGTVTAVSVAPAASAMSVASTRTGTSAFPTTPRASLAGVAPTIQPVSQMLQRWLAQNAPQMRSRAAALAAFVETGSSLPTQPTNSSFAHSGTEAGGSTNAGAMSSSLARGMRSSWAGAFEGAGFSRERGNALLRQLGARTVPSQLAAMRILPLSEVYFVAASMLVYLLRNESMPRGDVAVALHAEMRRFATFLHDASAGAKVHSAESARKKSRRHTQSDEVRQLEPDNVGAQETLPSAPPSPLRRFYSSLGFGDVMEAHAGAATRIIDSDVLLHDVVLWIVPDVVVVTLRRDAVDSSG